MWSAQLQKANLRGANLCKAQLLGANLQEAQLQGVNLVKSKLPGTNLHKAQLHEALLLGANLQEAQLCSANLRETKLLGADIQKADLRDATLQETEMQGACMYKTQLPHKLGRSDLRGVDSYCNQDPMGFIEGIKSRIGEETDLDNTVLAASDEKSTAIKGSYAKNGRGIAGSNADRDKAALKIGMVRQTIGIVGRADQDTAARSADRITAICETDLSSGRLRKPGTGAPNRAPGKGQFREFHDDLSLDGFRALLVNSGSVSCGPQTRVKEEELKLAININTDCTYQSEFSLLPYRIDLLRGL